LLALYDLAYKKFNINVELANISSESYKTDNNDEKIKSREIKSELSYLLHRAWFIIVALGIWALMIEFYYEYINQPSSTSETPEKKWNWINFISSFFSKEGYYIFGILLSTIFIDFIILFFDKMSQLHNNVVEFRGKIKRSIENLQNVSTKLDSNIATVKSLEKDLLKVASAATKEIEFLNINQDNNQYIRTAYLETINKLRQTASEELVKYKNSNDLIENKIPAIYITEIFKEYTNGEFFRNFANFGTMSQMVFELLNNKEILYKKYNPNGDEGNKIVYFTTLTMLPSNFLNPIKINSSKHFIREWNEFRRFFRKGSYLLKNENSKNLIRKVGEMLEFNIYPNKYEYVRVALMEDNDKYFSRKRKTTIKNKNQWVSDLMKQVNYHIVYKSIFPSELPIKFNSTIDEILKEHSDYYPDYADNISLKHTILKTSVYELFTNLYHPSPDCAKYFILSDANCNMIKKAVNNEYYKKSGKEFILELFNNIPIDIFAVGVKKRSSDVVEWKGCIAGYLGDSLEYMDLTWMDSVINSEKWKDTQKLIDYLYKKPSGKFEKLDTNFSSSSINIEKPQIRKISKFIDSDDYEFSREHSLLIDFIYEKKKSPKSNNILEIGGYYGRDAIELATFSNVEIIDKCKDGLSKFNDFIKQAKYNLNTGFTISIIADVIKLNGNEITYNTNDFLEHNFHGKKYQIICSYNVFHRFDKDQLQNALKKCIDLLDNGGELFHIFVSDVDINNTHNDKGYDCDIHSHDEISIKKPFINKGNIELKYRHILEYDNKRGIHPHVMWYLYFKKNN